MIASVTRRGWLARLAAALLAWAGLRPAARAQAPAACPHPLHRPLCADRPGSGLWFRTRLRLACPLCGQTVRHDGYLPDTAYAASTLAVTPDVAARWPADSGPLTYTYDTTRHLLAADGSWQAGALVATVTCDTALPPPDAP